MTPTIKASRLAAVEAAKANNALSKLVPSPYAQSLFDQWIELALPTSEIIEALRHHHINLEKTCSESDQQAPRNKLGITDSARMKQAEADITTFRMAELYLEET